MPVRFAKKNSDLLQHMVFYLYNMQKLINILCLGV